MKNHRKNDFKIDYFHGKLIPEKLGCESRLRNDLYFIGMVQVEISKRKKINIKLIAYEMPLKDKVKRSECIDLFGYDQNLKPWIIELKLEESSEKLFTVIKQINRYSNAFIKCKQSIQEEICQRFHWESFSFSEGIRKIILAERGFFKEKLPNKYIPSDIYCCSFARINATKNGKVILLKNNKKGIVRLKIENK